MRPDRSRCRTGDCAPHLEVHGKREFSCSLSQKGALDEKTGFFSAIWLCEGVIVTPIHLTQRSEFYHQLAQLTAAGLGLVRALEQLLRNPPAASYRKPIQQVLDGLAKGQTFTEALILAGRWLPAFDVTLIEAGEKSGRMDHSFRLLADYYGERATNAKEMISMLIYPAFLLHLLALVMTIVFWRWFTALILFPVAGLLIAYVSVALMVYAAQSRHGESWRAFIEALLRPMPVLGTGRHFLALSRLSVALESLISAGVTIIEAWELAAGASGSPFLRRTVLSWRPQLHAGQTPAEVLQVSPGFPELFKNQYAAGELAGKLDETMRRLHDYYGGEGSRKIRAVARWVPILISLLVMLIVAAFVIWFWLNYYGQMLTTF
jgi:type IV pilus assembly protein PilC